MRRAPVLLALLLLQGCTGMQSVLNPAGYGAIRVAELWWFMFVVGIAVWLIVMALGIHVLFIRRSPPSPRPIAQRVDGDRRRTRWVIGGVAATLAILFAVFIYSLVVSRSIHALARSDALTIEVVGHQWWWEVIYHDADQERAFVTANEIRVPVGEPVQILLRSRDVVHSFWVPNLSGKIDLIPGRTNRLWIRAEEPGTFRGQCAQFCGMQHAHMAFMVVAHTPDEYAQWAAAQREPAPAPTDPLEQRGQQVFLETGCAICHTIRGTDARASVAPDLTHVAGRLSLAAGILPNTPGHMLGWISAPQAIKPGNRMPRVELQSEELQALLAYLMTLR